METFDGAFTLSPESESVLFGYLQCDVRGGEGRGGGGEEEGGMGGGRDDRV